MTRGELEPGDCDGERETPWARAAWIDEENTLTLFDERPVGVTGKHCREPRGCGLETELPEVMNHVEGMGPDLDHVIRGQLGSPWILVVVTPDSAHGRDSPKRVENRESPDISAMDDEVASVKLLDSLRPDETVRIRDHTDNVPGRLGTRGFHECAKRRPLLARIGRRQDHLIIVGRQDSGAVPRKRSATSRLPSAA